MTTLPADKLRAMCERILAVPNGDPVGTVKGQQACMFIGYAPKIARALLELLPAEGEGELRKRGDDAEPRVQARLDAYLDADHTPIHQDGPSRPMPLSRQPGGEGQGWRDIAAHIHKAVENYETRACRHSDDAVILKELHFALALLSRHEAPPSAALAPAAREDG